MMFLYSHLFGLQYSSNIYTVMVKLHGKKIISKLLKIFCVVTRRHILVYDQCFGITCLSHLQGLLTNEEQRIFPKTPKIGQTSDPETLVINQKMTPGNNPEDFKQHYDLGGSLQLQFLST
jgi:hypothetical protein